MTNLNNAFEVAERYLDIPKMLDAEGTNCSVLFCVWALLSVQTCFCSVYYISDNVCVCLCLCMKSVVCAFGCVMCVCVGERVNELLYRSMCVLCMSAHALLFPGVSDTQTVQTPTLNVFDKQCVTIVTSLKHDLSRISDQPAAPERVLLLLMCVCIAL